MPLDRRFPPTPPGRKIILLSTTKQYSGHWSNTSIESPPPAVGADNAQLRCSLTRKAPDFDVSSTGMQTKQYQVDPRNLTAESIKSRPVAVRIEVRSVCFLFSGQPDNALVAAALAGECRL